MAEACWKAKLVDGPLDGCSVPVSGPLRDLTLGGYEEDDDLLLYRVDMKSEWPMVVHRYVACTCEHPDFGHVCEAHD